MRLRLLRLAGAAVLAFAAPLLAQLDFGPYVQNTSDRRATVIWYTKNSEAGVLRYGKQVGAWQATINVPAGTVHRVAIAGLQPNSKYFYEIGNTSNTLASGQEYYFRTHPRPGASVPFRFAAFGDFGDGSETQKATAARLLQQDGKHHFALLLGDIIYSSGERANYLRDYFPVYQDIIRHRAWWPTLGNHDIKSEKAAAYFEFFETPANNPTKVENYYSFDYANAHFVSLDDELLISGSDLQKQLDWVRQDLQDAKARGQRWLIVMWHKPPYSAGTHSDDEFSQENFNPVLEAEGVDLVLNGHSHVAERTFLLAKNTIVNQHLSRYPKKGFEQGAVFVVSGAGGKTGSLDGTHKLMAFQLGNASGFESIYIHGDTLTGSWIKSNGESMDQFTMIKSGSAPTEVQIVNQSAVPVQFALPHPNPFRLSQAAAGMQVAFEITNPVPVEAMIYDMLGREVARLSAGQVFGAGSHILRWNGRDSAGNLASAGVYLYRIHAGSRVHTTKLVVLQ